MSVRDPEEEWWWRRPRPPLAGFLAVEGPVPWYLPGKAIAFLGLGIACLWGLGASVQDWPWWGRAISVAVAVAGFAGIVALAAYLHRPVDEELRYDVAEAWVHDLARHGRVDLGVRVLPAIFSVAFTAAFVVLDAARFSSS